MKLNLSFVAAWDRETGEVAFLAQAAHLSGGGDVAEVAAAHELLRGQTPEGAELRAKYSHALFVVDNVERTAYEFPCPVAEEKQRLQRELNSAQEAARAAGAKLEAARIAAANAKTAGQSLAAAQKTVADLEKELADLTAEKPPEKAEETLVGEK